MPRGLNPGTAGPTGSPAASSGSSLPSRTSIVVSPIRIRVPGGTTPLSIRASPRNVPFKLPRSASTTPSGVARSSRW